MDLDNYRSILDNASVDIWLLIDAALAVASVDYTDEFKRRREGIVERIYTTTSASPPCRNCVANNNAETEKIVEEELNPHGGLFNDDENKKKILEIKQQLEYTNQSEDTLVELLHNLDDIDITFQALKRQKDSNFDSERLAATRKRLHENYKEVANAKKQRKIQVMDLHE
ncbi:hypothetical protein TanjilG_21816 [Lupinus angustifolius]|uniref:Uncharacterized protein n=1 Tax=Lupinus angustifolius TaxID=3871 RepID=A0A394DLF4_LUPAN|nr:hypothetical protein TanjilG_21816 [Lupinus angustifolius]